MDFIENGLLIKYSAPLKATAAYFILYYIFLYLESGVAFYLFHIAKSNVVKDNAKVKVSFTKIKYDNADNKLWLVAKRSVGNTMEQAFPFLTAMWLHAFFVSPQSAAAVAWVYIATRSYYPIVFYFGLPWILFSTLPGYACIFYLFYRLFNPF